MIFSASRLKTWMSCPLQAYFKYEEHLPSLQNAAASWGSILHNALEYYNTSQNFDGARKLFLDQWWHPEDIGLEPAYWPPNTSHAQYLKLGIAILEDFHKRQRWQGRTVIGAEIPFKVPFGDHHLTGYIDLLEVRKSGRGKPLLRILDYKSAGRQPTRIELAMDIQFTVYDYAVTCPEFWMGDGSIDYVGLPDGENLMEEFGSLAHRGIWYHLRTQKEIDVGPRTDVDYMRLYRVCAEVAKATEAQIHVPKIGEPCNLCDYAEACTLDIPVHLRGWDAPAFSDENAWI